MEKVAASECGWGLAGTSDTWWGHVGLRGRRQIGSGGDDPCVVQLGWESGSDSCGATGSGGCGREQRTVCSGELSRSDGEVGKGGVCPGQLLFGRLPDGGLEVVARCGKLKHGVGAVWNCLPCLLSS